MSAILLACAFKKLTFFILDLMLLELRVIILLCSSQKQIDCGSIRHFLMINSKVVLLKIVLGLR